MKNNLNKIALFSCMLIISTFAYTQPGTADFFSITPTKCGPDSTVFFNTSNSTASACDTPTSFFWDFGDPASGAANTSTLENPKHLFTSLGTYNVKFKAIWPCGTDSITKTITVSATINAPDTTCNNNALFFTGPFGATTWNWNFGDGSPSVSGQMRIHIYEIPGNYTIQLILTKACGKDTSEKDIVVTGPISKFTVTIPDPLCIGTPLNFLDSSTAFITAPIDEYYWEFGDGGLDSIQSPSHTYTNFGSYEIYHRVRDTAGCYSHYYETITIAPDTNITDINYTASCPCNELIFTGVGNAVSWNWNFGDGTSSNVKSPNLHSYSMPGKYEVSLTGIDASGCKFKKKEFIAVCPNDTVWTSKSNNNWVFYNNLQMDFSTGAPVLSNSGMLASGLFRGPTATVSDPKTGDLMFYTDGEEVWDASHTTMPNGSGLIPVPSPSSSQTMVIPFPGDQNKYYSITREASIFTTPAPPINMYYSVIDMSLNGGMGDVDTSEKQIFLTTFFQGLFGGQGRPHGLTATTKTEMTCTQDAEYWLVIPTAYLEYKVFLVDSSGINPSTTYSFPILPISQTPTGGIFPDIFDIRFSPNGTKIIVAGSGGMYLYDFDKATGEIKNQQYIETLATTPIYLAFSPNSQYVYEAQSSLVQYNILSNDIKGTAINLGFTGGSIGGIQIGNDNKIYLTNASLGKAISVINNPDELGTATNFVVGAIPLGGGTSKSRLQNLLPLNLPVERDTLFAGIATDSLPCPSMTINFLNISDDVPPLSNPCSFFVYDTLEYIWDYGDGQTSTIRNPGAHTYSVIDTYTVSLIINRPFFCYADTFVGTVILDTVPTVSITSDTVCALDTTHFISTTQYIDTNIISYDWSNSITDSIPHPTKVFSSGGSKQVTLVITDTLGCTYISTDFALVDYFAVAFAGQDTTICNDALVNLSSGLSQGGSNLINSTITYSWKPTTGISNPAIPNSSVNPISTQTYTVLVSNNCNTDSATINITEVNCVVFTPNAFSPNGDGINDIFNITSSGVKDYLIKIFDRWGNKVFESQDKNEGWHAEGFNKGVYVYWLNVTLLNDLKLEQKGNVTLIR